jgi:hypothetical protein
LLAEDSKFHKEITMKIFVSWSGGRSRAVAELMSDWLKCVIQASQPWISTRDIDRGAIWFSEINDKLKDVTVGVVCLTQENKNKPWIIFETGALAKGLTTNRVCTFLIDLNPEDLEDPIAQFNHTMPNKISVWEFVRTINSCLEGKSLDERILSQVFETYWPQFEIKFLSALEENPPADVVAPRSEQDILTEILNNTRSLSHRIRELESTHNFKNMNLSNYEKDLFLRFLEMKDIGKYSEDDRELLINNEFSKLFAGDFSNSELTNIRSSKKKNIANK